MKGFLTLYQRPFRKTHDVSELSPDCLSIDSSLRPALAQAEALAKYAWKFRYPGAPYEPDAAEAADGLREAEAVVREIQKRLPSGAG